jgi:hypothetical protein|tara:strand:+ start:600 stop:986 length:387 start_codon:yes stop_codon:yes gene_type:complete
MTDKDPNFMDGFDNNDSFGFMAVNEDELKNLIGGVTEEEKVTPEQISEIQDKLQMIVEMNSTCEGAGAVKAQYDELLKAKMNEIEQLVLPLLINLKKNGDKDYLYWPGAQRTAQVELQAERILNITQN